MACMNNTEKKLKVIFGDVTLGVQSMTGKEFRCIFSYAAGGMESLQVEGKEWVYRVPRPTFWRATTDNDRGNKFPIRSGMWLSADQFLSCVGVKAAVDGEEIPLPVAPENNRYSDRESAQEVKITYTYETITVPSTQVEVSYTVLAEGAVRVNVSYEGKKGLPELPVFGLRMIMPTCADKFVYEGLSGETYPDRKAGGQKGIYEITGMPVTPYLVPQDCGVHMQTKWLEVRRTSVLDNTKGERRQTALKFGAYEGEEFAFSCLPYTALELENATHHEELPPVRRTVVSILGAVRGVGGIDSWGADVEKPYHISAQEDIRYRFWIR